MQQTTAIKTNLFSGALNGSSNPQTLLGSLDLSRMDFAAMELPKKDFVGVPMSETTAQQLVAVFIKDVKPEHVYTYVMSKVLPYGMDEKYVEKILKESGYSPSLVTG